MSASKPPNPRPHTCCCVACVLLAVLILTVAGTAVRMARESSATVDWVPILADPDLNPLPPRVWVYTNDDLLAAIRAWESCGGRVLAGGDGVSLGAYGITREFWNDALEWARGRGIELGEEWEYEPGVWDEVKCRRIIGWYWQRYGAVTLEDKARMHKGGPDGPHEESTRGYWLIIRDIMETTPQRGEN